MLHKTQNISQGTLVTIRPWCGNCYNPLPESDPELLRCRGCQMIDYCSDFCRIDSWEYHRKNCLEVRKRYVLLDYEEQDIRTPPSSRPDWEETWKDPFDVMRGYFIGTESERYLTAATSYLDELVKVHSYRAIESALDHCVNIFSLRGRAFNHERCYVPFLYLRIRKLHECWAFICWAVKNGADGNRPEVPWVLEAFKSTTSMLDSVDALCDPDVPLDLQLSAILLKIALYLQVKQDLKTAAAFQECNILPAEVCGMIEEALVQNTMGKNYCPANRKAHSEVSSILLAQIQSLFGFIDKQYPGFWNGFLTLLETITGSRAPTRIVVRQWPWITCAVKAWNDLDEAISFLLYLWHAIAAEWAQKAAFGEELEEGDPYVNEWDVLKPEEIKEVFEGWE